METIVQLFGIENNQLLKSALTHKSILSNDEATKKFGICQNTLAAKGDARLKSFIVDYIHEKGLSFATQTRFEMNISMHLWAESLNIIQYFIIGTLGKENHTHAIGTFVEALIELVYQKYGHATTELFIRNNYFTFVETYVNSSAEATNLSPDSKIIVKPPANNVVRFTPVQKLNQCTQSNILNSVKDKVSEYFGRKTTIISKKKSDNNYYFKISFYHGYGLKTKQVFFESVHHNKTIALDMVCTEVLDFLKIPVQNYA
jgi:hypothetical protein